MNDKLKVCKSSGPDLFEGHILAYTWMDLGSYKKFCQDSQCLGEIRTRYFSNTSQKPCHLKQLGENEKVVDITIILLTPLNLPPAGYDCLSSTDVLLHP
jgi:hypothetical protein